MSLSFGGFDYEPEPTKPATQTNETNIKPVTQTAPEQDTTGQFSFGGLPEEQSLGAPSSTSLTDMKTAESSGLSLGGYTNPDGSEFSFGGLPTGTTSDSGAPQGTVQQPDATGGYPWEEGDAMSVNADGTWNEPTDPSWVQNKNFIIGQVQAGTADAGQQAWYDKYTWRMAQTATQDPAAAPATDPATQTPTPSATTTPTGSTATSYNESAIANGAVERQPNDGMHQDATGKWLDGTTQEWLNNKAYILDAAANGTITPEQQNWLDKYNERMSLNDSITTTVNPLDSVDAYSTGSAAGDKQAAAIAGAIATGQIEYGSLTDEQKSGVLDGFNQALASDPSLWPTITDLEFKNAYIAKHGDPQSGVIGTDANTINENGAAQGQYQADSGGAFQGTASTAESMGDMDVESINAAFAAKNGRNMTQEEMSSYQINQMLKSDSPLMMLAKQQGIDYSNSRGNMNSSLAAGNSMAAMADKATPLALQDAQTYAQMNSQNQELESMRLEANAGREQDASLFNADSENKATSQEFGTEADIRMSNAGLETDTSTNNAGMANDILNADRDRDFKYNFQQLVGDQDYAKQTLASESAETLQSMSDENRKLISVNDSASKIMASLQTAIGDILNDPKIKGAEATTKVDALIKSANDTLSIIGAINGLDFNSLLVDSAGSQTSAETDWTQAADGSWLLNGKPFSLSGFGGSGL